MSVIVSASRTIDEPFRRAYAGAPRFAGTEFGLSGIDAATEGDIPQAFSAWLPGDRPAERLAALETWNRQRRRFRFLFPERYHAPAREAHALFTGMHVGMPIHLLVKVQAHPDTLFDPAHAGEGLNWLREPVLNRLPLAIWMQGPVADVRVVSSSVAGANTRVVMLRHKAPARQSILELSISSELRCGSAPAIHDRFEATGSDGILSVHGIWGDAVHAPRLHVRRGATDFTQRDLRRDFAQVFENAAADWNKSNRKKSYALAEAYLATCTKIVGRIAAQHS